MNSKASTLFDAPATSAGQSVWLDNLSSAAVARLNATAQSLPRCLRSLSEVSLFDTGVSRTIRLVISPLVVRPVGLDTRRTLRYAPVKTSYGDVIHHTVPAGEPNTMDGLASWVEGAEVVNFGEDILLPDGAAVAGNDFYRGWLELPWNGAEIVCLKHESDLFFPGVDFVQQADRLILLDATVGLVGKQLTCVTRRKKQDGRSLIASSSVAVDSAIAARRRNTLRNLQQHAVEAAGLFTAPIDGTVVSCTTVGERTRVTTSEWECLVPGVTRYAVGAIIRRGDQVGGCFKLLNGDGQWWRAADWRSGVELDTLWPIPGIRTDNSNITVSMTGGKLVVSGLQGPEQNLRKLAAWLATAQTFNDRLPAALGLSEGESLVLPALDFLIGHAIGARRVVVIACTARCRDLSKSVMQQLPLSCVPLRMLIPDNGGTPLDLLTGDGGEILLDEFGDPLEY